MEGLIWRGYFHHFIEAVEAACNNERCEKKKRSESPIRDEEGPLRDKIREIQTIFADHILRVIQDILKINTKGGMC